MVLGECVLIVAPSTRSPLNIGSPFPNWMTCWTWCRATIFLKIDLKSDYHQIRTRPIYEWKTLLRLKTIYMSGWSCLLAWQMLPALSCEWWPKYYDPLWVNFWSLLWYILIYSKTLEHHVGHLSQVCHTLRKEQLYANPKKCVFMTDMVVFLGLYQLKGFSWSSKNSGNCRVAGAQKYSRSKVFMSWRQSTVDS